VIRKARVMPGMISRGNRIVDALQISHQCTRPTADEASSANSPTIV
jgi:hypothetical protein